MSIVHALVASIVFVSVVLGGLAFALFERISE